MSQNLSADIPLGYEAVTERAGIIPTGGLAAIELTGPDRLEWLQGQVTNDLRSLQPGDALSFCLTKPTGQLLALGTLWNCPKTTLIVTGQPEVVLKRVEEMVIMEEVEAQKLDLKVISVQGAEAVYEVSQLGNTPEQVSRVEIGGEEVLASPSHRTAEGGFDFLVGPGGSAENALREALPLVSPEAQNVLELEGGIPRFGVDTDEKTLPPELGPDFDKKHISYAKGCYTGQEVLMRIHSRGHTNKTWVGLRATRPIPTGVKLQHEGKTVGEVSRAAYSPAFGFIGAATLRNQASDPGTKLELADNDLTVEVVRMPFKRAF
jgi:folate-binding protein YgfZ